MTRTAPRASQKSMAPSVSCLRACDDCDMARKSILVWKVPSLQEFLWGFRESALMALDAESALNRFSTPDFRGHPCRSTEHVRPRSSLLVTKKADQENRRLRSTLRWHC